jgi:uncharacterized protein YjiS (DUF1127 family)
MLRNRLLEASLIGDGAIGRQPLRRDHWRVWTQALVSIVALWIERGRSRGVLATLDDHQLRDIGVSRADALHESEKPFWMS